MKITKATTGKQIKREWHLVDVNDKILGRTAVAIAHKLMGKEKPYFINNLDCGDYVVVVNAKKVRATGNKEIKKKYTNYSGFPGGLRVRTLKELREQNPTEIIERAVAGMLPKNKLRAQMLKRLYVFPDENHKFKKELGIEN